LRPDPFDPAKLRLTQDFTVATGVKKLLTTVPVRKPGKESFVQTHTSQPPASCGSFVSIRGVSR